ncbi:MAG: HAMP domain-containing histidine kinase, partial [Gammaproteobacteria bacterium]|nr:HAMP domain-containing histidine kinase [Gammaproteobacteria bacterium]
GGNHLLQLINEILDLSRIESGSIELKPEPVILEELFAECIRLTESLAEQQKVDVKLMSDKQVVVNVDRIRLKQVILNLLSNAIKYNRKGGTVVISVEKAENNRVLLQIEDTGYGISAEELKDVFQPFKRLEAAHGEIEGTGIGLTITRSIVEIMGSKLELVSEKDKGSRFWFELPLA